MAVTFSSIGDQVPGALAAFETKIDALTSKPELTTGELFDLQRAVTEWSLATNTYSTVLKSLGDSLRGTLQKIN